MRYEEIADYLLVDGNDDKLRKMARLRHGGCIEHLADAVDGTGYDTVRVRDSCKVIYDGSEQHRRSSVLV